MHRHLLTLLLGFTASPCWGQVQSSQYINISTFGRSLVDDAAATNARDTLGATSGVWGDAVVVDALTVSGGTVNNSIIGGTAAAAGTFTTLSFTDVPAAQVITFNGRSKISSAADSTLLVTNNAANNFDKLQFGGTTSGFPALTRNGAGLNVTDAAGGSYTDLLAGNLRAVNGYFQLKDGMTAPTAVATTSHIFIDTADGDLKIRYGDNVTRRIVSDSAEPTELTIATDAVTCTDRFHRIDTEADAATDDLATINGGASGETLTLKAENDARTVVVKDGTGNLQLEGDCTLDNAQDTITLIYDGSNWLELSRSNNGA